MSMNIWDDRENTLDLNGPTISTSTNPSSANIWPFGYTAEEDKGWQSFNATATSSFPTGLATAYATNTGSLAYEWYEITAGKLGPSTTYTGESSDTLQVKWAGPDENGNQYYAKMSYSASAYGTADPITAGTARSTGNAINGEIYSEKGTLTVLPQMEISTGPSSATAIVNNEATFNVVGGLSDTGQGSISYQWQIGGSDVSNGTRQTQSSVTTFVREYESSDGNSILTIPDDATNISIEIGGGAGGYGGSDSNGSGGSAGQGRKGKFTIPDGGRTLTINVGPKGGNDGGNGGDVGISGGDGGNGGNKNNSGGGGGGGAGTYVYDSITSTYILAAGGGGGGGGGSWNDSGHNGSNAGNWQSKSSGLSGWSNGGNGGC